MPPEAKVFIADKSVRWLDNYSRWLPKGGHQIVGSIRSAAEVGNAMRYLKSHGGDIEVAIVDRTLSNSSVERGSIVRTIKREYPSVKIIGTSFGPKEAVREEVDSDLNLNKEDIEPRMIVDLITGI